MRSRHAISALALALLALPSGAAARGLPGLLTQVRPGFHVRPTVVVYTGDGTGILGGAQRVAGRRFPRNFGRLRWRTWNRREAATIGTAWLNDCSPSCAGGRFHPYRARIRADRVRRGHFTRLTISYRYRGQRFTDRRVLERSNGVFIWGIP